MAAVESINAMVTGNLISLSAQEIVDCDDLGQHCEPGDTADAYKYMMRNRGIDTDGNYPYVGFRQECSRYRVRT